MKTDIALSRIQLGFGDHDMRVEEEGGTFKYVCNNCGKTMPKKDKMRRHVEVHLDVTHPCAMCDKTFKTRNALSHHYSGVHGQNVSYSRC